MDYFHREIRTDVGVDYHKAKMEKKCDVLECRQIQLGHNMLNDCAINRTHPVPTPGRRLSLRQIFT